MISKKDIKHIATLSRIDLNDKDIKVYQKKIKDVLDYVKKIKKADIDGVSSFKSVSNNENVFKSDKPKSINKQESQSLVNSAPDNEDGFIKTKPIFKKEK